MSINENTGEYERKAWRIEDKLSRMQSSRVARKGTGGRKTHPYPRPLKKKIPNLTKANGNLIKENR